MAQMCFLHYCVLEQHYRSPPPASSQNWSSCFKNVLVLLLGPVCCVWCCQPWSGWSLCAQHRVLLALRAQMSIYFTRSSCLYFCWHHSTTQPWCFQPSTWFAAACHYTLIKMLDMKGGRLAFFHFCLSPHCGKQRSCAKLHVICR